MKPVVLSYSVRDPNGIRTRVNAVKGRRPRPLNDGAAVSKAIVLPREKHTGAGRICQTEPAGPGSAGRRGDPPGPRTADGAPSIRRPIRTAGGREDGPEAASAAAGPDENLGPALYKTSAVVTVRAGNSVITVEIPPL